VTYFGVKKSLLFNQKSNAKHKTALIFFYVCLKNFSFSIEQSRNYLQMLISVQDNILQSKLFLARIALDFYNKSTSQHFEKTYIFSVFNF